MKEYILSRMREASTWRGIALLLTAAGVVFSPDQTNAFVTAGLAVSGVIGTFLPDRKAPQ